MRDEVFYRCINQSCARALPRKVNYCPYCGIGQATALPRPQPPRAAPVDHGVANAASAAASASSLADAATSWGRGAAAATTPDHRTWPDTADARAGSASTAAFASAASASASEAAAAPAASAAASPAVGAADLHNKPHIAAAPSTPAGPRPVRLRWILLILAGLWLAWLTQRPDDAAFTPVKSRLEARIDKAVALAAACKANEAQAELIALKNRATTAQLARLQGALDDADLSCRRGERRAGATARSGASAANKPASQPSQSVRNLLADARAALARGNYRAAADRMEVCVTMVDADTRECSALKARAERLDSAMQQCLARGGEWIKEACQ